MLTGTPLQNDLEELQNLLHFMLPDVFGKEDIDALADVQARPSPLSELERILTNTEATYHNPKFGASCLEGEFGLCQRRYSCAHDKPRTSVGKSPLLSGWSASFSLHAECQKTCHILLRIMHRPRCNRSNCLSWLTTSILTLC